MQATDKQPIHEAAARGDVEALKRELAKGINADFADNERRTSLILAARNGSLEAVKLLVEHKAALNKGDEFGWTSLHVACLNGSADIAAFLLDNGANIEKRTGDAGETPLLIAASYDQPSCVKLLIDRKADTSAKATNGHWKRMTALDIAQRTSKACVALLQPSAATAAPSTNSADEKSPPAVAASASGRWDWRETASSPLQRL